MVSCFINILTNIQRYSEATDTKSINFKQEFLVFSQLSDWICYRIEHPSSTKKRNFYSYFMDTKFKRCVDGLSELNFEIFFVQKKTL